MNERELNPLTREEEIKKTFFLVLKEGINIIISQNENHNVDIETIAEKCGITKIQRVPSKSILDKHAILIGTEIYVNKDDNPEKQRFAIAHEIFHFLTKWPMRDSMQSVARQGEAWKKQNEGSLEADTEVIADYFAANLLIPTEHFILLENKSDEEIANVFGVEAKCIGKRREEIENELDLITPNNLSSDIDLKNQAPLSLDELDHVLEGYNNHDSGRA